MCRMELSMLYVCRQEVKGRKPTLTALVSCGRALQDYVQENGAVGVADIGYTKVEQRYDTLSNSSLAFLSNSSLSYIVPFLMLFFSSNTSFLVSFIKPPSFISLLPA